MNKRKVLFLVTSCLFMTACNLEDRLIAKAEEKYDESFKEVFGNIDPEHTWSMVENNTVAVNIDQASRVKIYAKMDRTYYLVGDYENVSGSKELSFDAPRGCEDIMVTVNDVPLQKDGSRAILCSSDPSQIVYADDSEDKYHYYTWGQVDGFYKDTDHLPEGKDNAQRIKQDYLLVSNGEIFTFSPTFWNAAYDHTYGIFYYENGEKKEIDFYRNKGGDQDHQELQFLKKTTFWGTTTTTWETVNDAGENCSYSKLYSSLWEGRPIYSYKDDEKMLRAQHFHIKLAKGTIFGFYLKANGQKYYSDRSLNDEGDKDFSAFGHIEIDGFTYIVVEDQNSGQKDYNDFVFTMKGVHEHINTTEPISYLYATEDLGGTDDFDFNDVIFSVSHVSGQPYATVKLMAAGGILPAYIYFNNQQVGAEVHEAFGKDVKEMVNTSNGSLQDFVVLSETVEVGENWTHVAFTDKGNGFNVKIENNHKTFIVGTPGANNGEAPQMLILNRDWLWPTERTRINTAYPDFDQWGANYLDYLWVNNWDSNKVVNRDLTDEYPHAH